METKISIIVPCFRQAQYLDACLQSVVNQTYENWECIIIDDGSPDETEEVANKWLLKDNRFQYYRKENGGVASARNFGIDKATGEWVIPLDGDDKIGNEYLALAAKHFDEQYTLIYCNAEFFGDSTGIWNLASYSYNEMLVKNHIFCSAFFKKQDWLKTGGYDTSFVHGHEDWDFWLSILEPDSKVLKLDYVGFYYRRKQVSRDILLNISSEKQQATDKQIFTKHILRYTEFDTNPIKNFKIQQEKNRKLESLLKEINKSIFSRLLHKIIEKI